MSYSDSAIKEQVLSDGAHFELSPMYHCIMLGRVLDCYNLVSQNALFNQELESFLKKKAGMMLGWLEKIVFKNGDIPLMNDAAFGIALTYRQLKRNMPDVWTYIRILIFN